MADELSVADAGPNAGANILSDRNHHLSVDSGYDQVRVFFNDAAENFKSIQCLDVIPGTVTDLHRLNGCVSVMLDCIGQGGEHDRHSKFPQDTSHKIHL